MTHDRLIEIELDTPPIVSDDNLQIQYFKGTYNEFFHRFLVPNIPCLLSNVSQDWKSTLLWTTNNAPNIDYLSSQYGKVKVTVANCAEKFYNSQSKSIVKFEEFADYWKKLIKNNYPESEPCLYLKDWHFTKDFPDENVYTVPPEFSSDWLNEYFTAHDELNDDYRFVYMGPKGSWTPFHCDVFSSYSWSVNVCGRKKWVLLPPGEELKLKDETGHLPYDISFLDESNNNKLSGVKYMTVYQNVGDAIFVPSGWHHQVWNMADTISINHNWVNACNVDNMFLAMSNSLEDAKNEIVELQYTMDGWEDQCQLLLKSCFGMDFNEFYNFLKYILKRRKSSLSTKSSFQVYGNWFIGCRHLEYDFKKAEALLDTFLDQDDVKVYFDI